MSEKIEKLFFRGKHGWRIRVYVRPQSSVDRLELEEEGLIYYTTEPPLHGRANASLLKALSRIFKVSTSQIEIVFGARDKSKVVEIRGKDLHELVDALKKLTSSQ